MHTIPYLLLSFRTSPPLHQEIVALGEAWGRHSKSTSPPLWITVDFFTARRVKSGGEAEEQTHVKAICLALWRGNSCASAKMSNASPAITAIIFHQTGLLYERIMEMKERCHVSASSASISLFFFTLRKEAFSFPWQHNVHIVSLCLQLNSLHCK